MFTVFFIVRLFVIDLLGDRSENGENLVATTEIVVFVDDNAADVTSQAIVVAAFFHERIGGFHLKLPVAAQEIAVTRQVEDEAIQSGW